MNTPKTPCPGCGAYPPDFEPWHWKYCTCPLNALGLDHDCRDHEEEHKENTSMPTVTYSESSFELHEPGEWRLPEQYRWPNAR